MIGTMTMTRTRGRHARALAAVRAWRVLSRPAVIRRAARAVLILLAAAAGSLMVLAARRGDRAGFGAAALLGVFALIAIAVWAGPADGRQDTVPDPEPGLPPNVQPLHQKMRQMRHP